MNMIMMLIIFTIIGFASIIMMCAFKGKMSPKIWNAAFIAADAVAFFFWNLAAFDLGWLDEGWMTLENISPLCCTLILLTPFLKDGVRQYVYDFIAFLSLGLFAAMLLSPEFAYFFNYNIEANPVYTAEAASHLVCCLFGIYLVLSGQVKTDFKSWGRSIACAFTFIGLGVLLNYVFHKTYFGMNPYGESSIYMLDIFDTHELTLLAYSMGVILVLTVGMQAMRFLDVTTDLLHGEEKKKVGAALLYHRIFDDETDVGADGGETPPLDGVYDRLDDGASDGDAGIDACDPAPVSSEVDPRDGADFAAVAKKQ